MTMDVLIDVECHAGGRADEEPRRLVFTHHAVGVRAVLDRWREPGGERFRLRGTDGIVYVVAHNDRTGLWLLVSAEQTG
jgi:hypothetical protein